MNIDAINTSASKATIVGWFAGLSYFGWWASDAVQVSFGAMSVLVVGGMFASSILIGGGVSLLIAGIAKALTGKTEGYPSLFTWGVVVSPVLAFFAARYSLLGIASLWPNSN